MKVATITIVFEDEKGSEVIASRTRDFVWSFDGPMYPGQIHLVSTIQNYCREFDRTHKTKEQKKEGV